MSSAAAAAETIGNYVIERALARGSMGQVYVAHHALTHARVALKVLRADLASDNQAEERFLREVRAAAHIGHEGIVRVYDAGRNHDGRLFLAMELLEGETLEQRLRKNPGERAEAMQWLLAVLEPLSAAHAQGIVHRDLKPANVFITQVAPPNASERVKLLDFGLARDTREKSVTATGIALGTPYYMSPEQASEPRKVSAASDVWSLGVMMYEVLCGAMPFDGETLHAVVIQSSVAPHVPASARAPELDARLTALVDECLSKDPSTRPADATALRERLAELLAGPEVQAQLAKPVEVAARQHATATTQSSEEELRMPFADTAYSLPPLQGAQTQLSTRRTGTGRSGARSGRGMLWLWIAALGLVAAATASFLWSMGRQPVAPPPSAAEAQQPSEPNAASAEDAREKTQRSKPKPATSPAGPDKRVLELAPPAPEAPVEGSAQGASTSPAR
ncbi:MAG TPA: protein kinase, partial [Polyangiales bacterium]|nr:protein kinase [Polyangiales bacterium]